MARSSLLLPGLLLAYHPPPDQAEPEVRAAFERGRASVGAGAAVDWEREAEGSYAALWAFNAGRGFGQPPAPASWPVELVLQAVETAIDARVDPDADDHWRTALRALPGHPPGGRGPGPRAGEDRTAPRRRARPDLRERAHPATGRDQRGRAGRRAPQPPARREAPGWPERAATRLVFQVQRRRSWRAAGGPT